MNSKQLQISSDSILVFMAEYGRTYLASGGPTSRLEEALSTLGRKMGYPTEVFGTPTGIFVSCMDRDGTTHTTLSRIKDGATDLGKLCWLEGIFEDVYNGKISLGQANRILNSKAVRQPPYRRWQTVLAALLSGFALSFPTYGSWVAALASGLIAVVAWWITGPGFTAKITSSVFRDFFASATTLALAALCQFLYPVPFEAFSIGGLVIIVPGLALTNAISELADQNLVSGTSKLMNAVLTLLAMGLAYILFQDLAAALGRQPTATIAANPMPFALSAVGMAISVTCFGVLFKVPRRALIGSTLTGLLGWGVLRLFGTSHFIAGASYSAALAVGLVSLYIGSRFKVPSQVFSVPGILAMLPGMMALTSFRSFAVGQQSVGLELAFLVALTAGSIVFGLFTARIPFAYRSKG